MCVCGLASPDGKIRSDGVHFHDDFLPGCVPQGAHPPACTVFAVAVCLCVDVGGGVFVVMVMVIVMVFACLCV